MDINVIQSEGPYLRALPVFEGLSCDETRKLGYAVVEKTYRARQLIFSAQSPVEYVYLVRNGRVKLYRQTEDGRENIIAILKPGDVFGEFVFGESTCHSVYAEAFGTALICILPHRKFVRMLLGDPEMAVRILSNVGRRLAQSAYFIETLSTYNLKLRFAKLLLYLTLEESESGTDEVMLDLRLTHQDLAYMVATCRQTITDLMKAFKKEGLADTQGRRIVVMRKALEAWIAEHSHES